MGRILEYLASVFFSCEFIFIRVESNLKPLRALKCYWIFEFTVLFFLELCKYQYECVCFLKVRARIQKMGAYAPMNIFLKQEIDRMQRVISTVRQTLTDLKLAIDGTIIMNETLRDALDCMFDARIPESWKRVFNCFLHHCYHLTTTV